jgi:putative endonuclease
MSIAAASILAKARRDHIMEEWHQVYPQYGFARHKGYATEQHLEALRKYGRCPIHRLSFNPRKLEHILQRSTVVTGREGEDLACEHLKRLGIQIVQRNYRYKHGEIDIVAREERTWLFIEVKTCQTPQFGQPETWVTSRKQKQIAKIAQAYLQQHHIENMDCRFDVVAIDLQQGTPQIQYFKDAFWCSR